MWSYFWVDLTYIPTYLHTLEWEKSRTRGPVNAHLLVNSNMSNQANHEKKTNIYIQNLVSYLIHAISKLTHLPIHIHTHTYTHTYTHFYTHITPMYMLHTVTPFTEYWHRIMNAQNFSPTQGPLVRFSPNNHIWTWTRKCTVLRLPFPGDYSIY